MLSKDKMKKFIITTITTAIDAMKKTLQEDIEKEINTKIDNKAQEKTSEVIDKFDTVTLENVFEGHLKTSEMLMQKAMQKNTCYEQYSRKNNIKIMGVPEMKDETIEILEDKMCEIPHTKASMMINPRL